MLRNRLLSDSILDEFFVPTFNTMFESNYLKDEEGNVVLEIEVPGFNKDNLNIEIADGLLTIQGQTETRKVFKKYTLGMIEDVEANLQDGILTLKLIEPKKKVKKITVE